MAKGLSLPVVQSGLESSIQQGVKNVGQINIPVNVDPTAFKNLAQPLGRVSGLATEFEKSIAASNARVLAFGASVGIINGVQNAFASLVKTGIEVQKTLADIAAISGKSGDELSKFGDAVFEVGKNTGQSFKTAAQAALEFSRQGLSVEETLKRTTDALTLTRFTSLNAAEAVDVLTAAANSFSETGITTAQIINKLVAVDTKFAVSAEDLANGLARAGSIAQEVGVNFDELNAAITVAQERTARGGAVIGNALKTIFTRLRSDETVQALRDIGVESLNAQGELKGAIPLLQELSQKLQGLSGGERVQILEAVASKYNINILSALLNDLNDANSKFGQAVGVSAGASNQAYERQIELNKTLAAQINNATVSVTQLFNKLAEIGVTESLGNLLSFVNDLINGFNKLLDSESLGGNIAKGLVKGISDVFFTIGLPIIGAIFVKLTKDVAQFGLESLKTILGINQQVRERQALEQAVVNTLIQDQQVMATILSYTGDRRKQEEYLLGIYNRQLAALQQVQGIASSVTPALMAGGLSATTGQVRKRGASGYLPAQEAADVRRGVGGASPSSKVVSIPNFAFGGGKRGTMIANTSEYIVPNFANGGSAIFNRDMAKAYGLPSGARKISAAGGYIPNFAAMGDYAALVGEKAAGEKGFLQNTIKYVKKGKDDQLEVFQSAAQGGEPIAFDIYGVPSQSVSQIARAKEAISETGKNLAVNIARSMTKDLPSDLVQGKLAATFNPGSLQSFANTVFEASIGSLLGDKRFDDYAEQATTSAFDLDITNNPNIKESLGIANAVKFLEVKGNKTPKLMDSVAKKIYQVTQEGRAATSTRKITREIAAEKGIPRPFVQKIGNAYTVDNQTFNSKSDVERYLSQKYESKFGITNNPSAKALGLISPVKRAALGYIPNFAQDALKDAIGREMAAGVNPSAIRITQDGRLRNAGNPDGLAVINTRDEPNGKIPNFASRNRPDSPSDIERARKRAEQQELELATKAAGGSLTVSFEKAAKKTEELTKKNEQLSQETEQASQSIQKLFYVTGALMTVNASLEQAFKNTTGGVRLFGDAISIVSKAAQAATTGALLGGQIKDMTKGMVGQGGAKGIIGAAGQRAPQIAIAAAIIGTVVDSLESIAMDRLENKEAKAAGQATAQNFIKTGDKKVIEDRAAVLRSRIFKQGGQDDQTNAEYDVIRKKLKEINDEEKKRKDAAEELAKKAREEAEEINKRVALATKLNEISLAFNEGENKAFMARVVAQGNALKNQEKLTELQKFANDESIKELEFQGRLRTSKSQGIQDLIKELSQKGALATVDEQSLNALLEKAKASGDFLSIEKEVQALAIKAAAGSQTAITNAKTKNTIEQNTLTTQENARKFLAEQNKYAEIQKAALQSIFNIQTKIAGMDRERVNAIKQAAAEMKNLKADSDVSAIEASQAGRPQTRADKAELATAKFSQFETSERSKLSEKRTTDQNAILEKYRNTAEAALNALTNLSEEDKRSIAIRLAQAKSIEDVTEAYSAAEGSATQTLEQQRLLGTANNLVKQAETDATEAINRRVDAEGYLIAQMENRITVQRAIAEQSIKEAESPFQAGMKAATDELVVQTDAFQNKLGKETVTLFRDGMRDAMTAAISQTDDLGSALRGVATGFLKSMQGMFMQNAADNISLSLFQKKASGGLITGGSGYKDDVPALLTGGEFVMRKSAVEKYGAANLAKMNSGGMFIPGTRGAGAISGEDALRAFANQTTTSGATDVLRGGGSSAFINLEDQSQRLSRYALLGDDTISQEVRGAQGQAFDILKNKSDFEKQQKEREKQEKKALTRQLISTVASAALSYGAGKINPIKSQVAAGSYKGTATTMTPYIVKGAYGGMIRRYASGGPTDDIPALLMSGEYVMNRGATSKYGKRMLDSMNQGRMPRFADGGEVGTSAPTTTTTESNAKMMGDVNISINVTGQNSQTETQGSSNQGGVDYKKMSERIKAVVLETLNEEKRLGGTLRTR